MVQRSARRDSYLNLVTLAPSVYSTHLVDDILYMNVKYENMGEYEIGSWEPVRNLFGERETDLA